MKQRRLFAALMLASLVALALAGPASAAKLQAQRGRAVRCGGRPPLPVAGRGAKSWLPGPEGEA